MGSGSVPRDGARFHMSRHHVASRSPTGERTDPDLVERCRLGDVTARRLLYEQHAGRLYRFISALGVPPDERDDVAQDVFMTVFTALSGFRGEAQLSTWIYRIAARHVGRLRFRQGLRVAAGQRTLEDVPSTFDPRERAISLHVLDGMLRRLTVKKRTVLVLFEIEGLTIDHIARVLGCPENTVWSRLHHARSEMLEMARRMS
jgi:RNA polymerase sigma-70 factor (ECF subfamily)